MNTLVIQRYNKSVALGVFFNELYVLFGKKSMYGIRHRLEQQMKCRSGSKQYFKI